MEMITCPNCKSQVAEEEIYPSFCTDSLLCCKFCKGKSKHKAIIGTDPALVFLEMQEKRQINSRFISTNKKAAPAKGFNRHGSICCSIIVARFLLFANVYLKQS